MPPMATPFGIFAVRNGLPTSKDDGNASASSTSPRSSTIGCTSRIRPRRTCSRIDETVICDGLMTASTPSVPTSGIKPGIFTSATACLAPVLFASNADKILTSSSSVTATNVSVACTLASRKIALSSASPLMISVFSSSCAK